MKWSGIDKTLIFKSRSIRNNAGGEPVSCSGLPDPASLCSGSGNMLSIVNAKSIFLCTVCTLTSGTHTLAVFSFPSVEAAHWARTTGRTVHMHEGTYTWVWCTTCRGGLMLCWWVDVWRLIPEWKLFISTIIDFIFFLWCCMVYWKKG